MEDFNLSTAKFSELRAYCKENKIEFKRTDTKDDLTEKISNFCAESLSESEEQDNSVLTYDSSEDLNEELKSLGVDKDVHIPKPQTTIDNYNADHVVSECNKLFAGRALAKYNKENPTMVEFHGGPRQRQDVTLKQKLSSILFFAKNYCSRAYVGVDATGAVEGASLANLDLASMTPEQQAKLAKNLSTILKVA
jgi:hypothetical protein